MYYISIDSILQAGYLYPSQPVACLVILTQYDSEKKCHTTGSDGDWLRKGPLDAAHWLYLGTSTDTHTYVHTL